jgi:hypothetical protein
MLTVSRRGSEKVVDAKPLWVEAQREFETLFGIDNTIHLREEMQKAFISA